MEIPVTLNAGGAVALARRSLNIAITGTEKVNRLDPETRQFVSTFPELDDQLQKVHYNLPRSRSIVVQVDVDITGEWFNYRIKP